MTKLLQVEIIENHSITGAQNALQYISRDATAMFLDYNEDLTGSIYLFGANVFKHTAIELDTVGIDWVVLSKHELGV